jgi:chemotaxis protein MotB
LKPERLAAVGYGEFKPVAPNDTEEGRAKNRRVVLVVMADENSGRQRDIDPTGIGPGVEGKLPSPGKQDADQASSPARETNRLSEKINPPASGG